MKQTNSSHFSSMLVVAQKHVGPMDAHPPDLPLACSSPEYGAAIGVWSGCSSMLLEMEKRLGPKFLLPFPDGDGYRKPHTFPPLACSSPEPRCRNLSVERVQQHTARNEREARSHKPFRTFLLSRQRELQKPIPFPRLPVPALQQSESSAGAAACWLDCTSSQGQ